MEDGGSLVECCWRMSEIFDKGGGRSEVLGSREGYEWGKAR